MTEPMADTSTTSGPPQTSPATFGRLARAGAGLLRLGGLILSVIAVMLVFEVLSSGAFLGVNNLLGILRSTSTVAIMGLGFLLVCIVGEIDLSFGFLYGLSASLVAVAWTEWGWPVWAAIGFAFLVAAGWGAFNAFFTTIGRLPSFIATLGSGTLIFGLTLLITNSNSFNPAYANPPVDSNQLNVFNALSNQALPFGFPMQGVWLIVVALIFWFVLSRTIFGFRLTAIGGNPAAARIARLPVIKYKFAAFIGCAMMACLAAVLDFSFIGSTQPNAGQDMLFPTFAAVIIGGASLSGGRGTVVGTITGAVLLTVLVNGIAVLAAGPFVQQMVVGAVTIGAVTIDQLTHRRATA